MDERHEFRVLVCAVSLPFSKLRARQAMMIRLGCDSSSDAQTNILKTGTGEVKAELKKSGNLHLEAVDSGIEPLRGFEPHLGDEWAEKISSSPVFRLRRADLAAGLPMV